jgi:hypothetical protein
MTAGIFPPSCVKVLGISLKERDAFSSGRDTPSAGNSSLATIMAATISTHRNSWGMPLRQEFQISTTRVLTEALGKPSTNGVNRSASIQVSTSGKSSGLAYAASSSVVKAMLLVSMEAVWDAFNKPDSHSPARRRGQDFFPRAASYVSLRIRPGPCGGILKNMPHGLMGPDWPTYQSQWACRPCEIDGRLRQGYSDLGRSP